MINKDKESKNQEYGMFCTRTRYIRARPIIKQSETIIDKNGEKFYGVYGDWHIWDENGYEYFLNKHEFKIKFQPINNIALQMIHKEWQRWQKRIKSLKEISDNNNNIYTKK